jgi:hypothetical protein
MFVQKPNLNKYISRHFTVALNDKALYIKSFFYFIFGAWIYGNKLHVCQMTINIGPYHYLSLVEELVFKF